MKVLHVGIHDTCGSAYMLCRAINRLTKHKAVNIRFVNDYMRWPAFIEGSRYSKQDIKKIIYKADVVHFHIHVKPFFSSLGLDPRKFANKKTFVYYHGSMLRWYGDELTKPARELLPDHVITVSTPDLLAYIPKDEEVAWFPVVRPFNFIQSKFGFTAKDVAAARSFGKPRITVFGHPVSNVDKKGSKVFFKALTDLTREKPEVRSDVVMNTPWVACIRKISQMDIVLGCAQPPVYGLVCVEAAIFKKPAVSFLSPETAALYKQLSGEVPPVITWKDEKDLYGILHVLAENPEIRVKHGEALYKYLRPLHDERPIVNYYLDLINGKD